MIKASQIKRIGLVLILQLCFCQQVFGIPQERNENDISKLVLSELGDLNDTDKEKIAAMNQIDKQLEESLFKAETVMDGIQKKLQVDSTQLADEERLKALQESAQKLHSDTEQVSKKKKNSSKQMDKIQEYVENKSKVIKENKVFSSFTESEIDMERRNKFFDSNKKQFKNVIMKEKQYFKKPNSQIKDLSEVEVSTQDYIKQVDDRKKIENKYLIQQQEALMRVENVISEQLNNDLKSENSPLIQKFETNKNANDKTEQKSIIHDAISNILEAKSDSDENEWYTETLNQKNQSKIIKDDGKKLDDLKREFDNETRIAELEQEVDDLLQQGDKLHEKFLVQTGYLETLIEDEQPKLNLEKEEIQTQTVDEEYFHDYQQPEIKYNQKLAKQDLDEEIKKKEQEQQDNENSFYKQIAFSIVLVLAILFMIFGSQFDLFSFFSQRRRAKDPFYRDDEAQQSLLS